jgi:microcystin-dependent protein
LTQPFLAEIRMFAGNFAPKGWALCSGQILQISQNTALFSLLGTTYGGNGTTTFALPNLGGQTPVGAGQGPGLSARSLGETGGEESVTLSPNQLPSHTHTASATNADGDQDNPGTTSRWGQAHIGRQSIPMYSASKGSGAAMGAGALAQTGAGQPHNNRHPYEALTFIIALQGVFPSRN